MALFRHSHGEGSFSLYFQYLPLQNATFFTCILVVATPPNPSFVSFILWNHSKSIPKGVTFWHPVLFKNAIFELFPLGLPQGGPRSLLGGPWSTRGRFPTDSGSPRGQFRALCRFRFHTTSIPASIFLCHTGLRWGRSHFGHLPDHPMIHTHGRMTIDFHAHIITAWTPLPPSLQTTIHIITWPTDPTITCSYDHMIRRVDDHMTIYLIIRTWSYDHKFIRSHHHGIPLPPDHISISPHDHLTIR